MKKSNVVILVLSLLPTIIFANTIDNSIKVIEKTNDKLKSYQKHIDKNEEIRENLLADYKNATNSLKNTKIYNIQLEKIIKSQEDELRSLEQQLIDIDETQKNIFPLMIDMIKSLKTLINKNIPFLLEERLTRVKKLEDALNKADIQTHEKYRIILEAFKIEYDYAKTIEAYQDKLNDKTYNFLRVGRTALYYQSLDLKDYGYYNKKTASWKIIEDMKSKSNIRKAIKIAKKQQNVEFLNLPFLPNTEISND